MDYTAFAIENARREFTKHAMNTYSAMATTRWGIVLRFTVEAASVAGAYRRAWIYLHSMAQAKEIDSLEIH